MPSSGEETVAEQLATVLRGYRKAMSAALTAEDYGPIMPAATWLLLAMDREPGTVGALARRLGLTKQAVSRLADRLVGLGYCDRRRSETNRREVLLQTSPEGARAAGVLRAGLEQADARFLGGLGEAERDVFRTTLAALAGTPAGG
ncbi:MAG TPA: MarR family transcriptional regulator [Streptosporangiaceae bacterium]|jgi:DNA-binding MarR family transcriptional regulator|nr:MarR family transcriptional regulator [Streptosporangiaceae bacterium]